MKATKSSPVELRRAFWAFLLMTESLLSVAGKLFSGSETVYSPNWDATMGVDELASAQVGELQGALSEPTDGGLGQIQQARIGRCPYQ